MKSNNREKEYVFGMILCLIFLMMPVAIIEKTSVYNVQTPSDIWYKYTTFSFSWFGFIIILYAFLRINKTKSIKFLILIGVLFIVNAFIPSEYNVFLNGRFEMFLIMLEACAVNYIVFSYDNNENELETYNAERFIQLYFILCFATTLLRLVLGMSTDGRFGAIGLSVGGTGYFSAIILLYLIYCREYSIPNLLTIMAALICLILSGQRTSIFVFAFLCLPFIIKILNDGLTKTNVDEGRQKLRLIFLGILYFAVLGILILLLLTGSGLKINGLNYVERVFDALQSFASGDLSQEASISGRQDSINAGLEIWKNNPLGIENEFYALQKRMTALNYPTFPHCMLLDIVLLWTLPIAVFVIIYVLKIWISLIKERDGLQWVIFFIIVMSIIWGSPFNDVPQLFIILFFLTLGKIRTSGLKKNKKVVIVFKGKRI